MLRWNKSMKRRYMERSGESGSCCLPPKCRIVTMLVIRRRGRRGNGRSGILRLDTSTGGTHIALFGKRPVRLVPGQGRSKRPVLATAAAATGLFLGIPAANHRVRSWLRLRRGALRVVRCFGGIRRFRFLFMLLLKWLGVTFLSGFAHYFGATLKCSACGSSSLF